MRKGPDSAEFQLLSFAAFWVIMLIATRTKPRWKQILCILGTFAIATPMEMSPAHEWLKANPQLAVLGGVAMAMLFFVAVYKPPKSEEPKPDSE